jgi:diaminopimelate epimerase
VIDVPLRLGDEDLRITSLSTGTAHSVIFCNELPGDEAFFAVSPQIERHPWFPERTNVLWCRAEGDSCLRLRIWERGAGETLACGTGVCAAAAAAMRRGLAGDEVSVICPGGAFSVRRAGTDLWLRGPAEIVFQGQTSPDFLP